LGVLKGGGNLVILALQLNIANKAVDCRDLKKKRENKNTEKGFGVVIGVDWGTMCWPTK
jgi:hypothetical protein